MIEKKVCAMIRYTLSNKNKKNFICAETEYTKKETLIIFKRFHNSILGGHLKTNKIINNI